MQDREMASTLTDNCSFFPSEWQCKSCTVVNQGSSVLCEVCERPRLATRPPVAPAFSSSNSPSANVHGQVCVEPQPLFQHSVIFGHGSFCSLPQWICQFCTFDNTRPTLVCEMCNLSCKPSTQQMSSPAKDPPQRKPRVTMDLRRQKMMKEDGLNLIHQIRVGLRSRLKFLIEY